MKKVLKIRAVFEIEADISNYKDHVDIDKIALKHLHDKMKNLSEEDIICLDCKLLTYGYESVEDNNEQKI